ncbi:MAG: hypothetical protein J5520_07880 [Bacteroidales bacterium]|nr:hypothetical protein [Bacteroidales bacterium]
MNLLNTEEATMVKGGESGIPPCKSVDLRCCVYDFFPGPGCGSRVYLDQLKKEVTFE